MSVRQSSSRGLHPGIRSINAIAPTISPLRRYWIVTASCRLTEELARDDLVAWLRNQDRKAWSLCVPYMEAGECKALYPDFLIVRDEGDGPVVDIIDPHSLGLSHTKDFPTVQAVLTSYSIRCQIEDSADCSSESMGGRRGDPPGSAAVCGPSRSNPICRFGIWV